MHLLSKILNISFLTVSILFMFNCEDPDELTATESSLLGNWEVVQYSMSTEAISSVDQDIFMRYSPGEGGINISGDLNVSLAYLINFEMGGGQSVIVTNSLFVYDELPLYSLQLLLGSDYGKMLSLSVMLADSTEYSFIANEFDASFDPATGLLNVAPITLITEDSTMTISLEGQLQMKQVHFSANESTQFSIMEGFLEAEMANTYFEFLDNFELEIHYTDNETGLIETNTGSWSLDSDEVTLTLDDDSGDSESIVMEIEIVDDQLSLRTRISCEDETDVTACIESKEMFYGFEVGTLVSLIEFNVMELQRVE